MKHFLLCLSAMFAVVLLACNQSGLSNAPRATFAQISCLNTNGDNVLNAQDAVDPSKLPDFDGDRKRDAQDAAFLYGLNIQLNPQRDTRACGSTAGNAPEYEVARGYFKPADVSCATGKQPVLVVGIGGGVVNVKDSGDAAGVRSIVDGLLSAYRDRGIQTIPIIAGPQLLGAANLNGGMEQWMTHAIEVYLNQYPCMRALLIGHSNGAVTADVAAAKLEAQYAKRIIEVVDIDRSTVLYTGDTTSRPTQVHVFNIYESNSGVLNGAPYNSPNAENWNASGIQAPKNGDKGGPLAQVNHTTIDNANDVKRRVIADALQHSA